jgi:hypothetical protein
MTSAQRQIRVALIALGVAAAPAAASPDGSALLSLDRARHAFYSGRYAEAAALALTARDVEPTLVETYEVRTSALLFSLRRELGDDRARRSSVDACTACSGLLATFHSELTEGQTRARARLGLDAEDEVAHYVLAKLNLNYVWLHNGLLGRRAGWRQYRDARRSLEATLERNPGHIRAQVALAWIEYIVDDRVPWGAKWLFGGGSRTRALEAMRRAAASNGSFYEVAEARFGLWDMLRREKQFDGAAAVARDLSRDFPDNPSLIGDASREDLDGKREGLR